MKCIYIPFLVLVSNILNLDSIAIAPFSVLTLIFSMLQSLIETLPFSVVQKSDLIFNQCVQKIVNCIKEGN